ncbi:VanZ family protein [Massilia sp. 9096]|uniref:VanZ family protein n=1 Tax=Massilia sp. 9096 TaxID=1500894 RepID=UPI00055D193F|nr:VanZ family protein [Massilia sp. 9096]
MSAALSALLLNPTVRRLCLPAAVAMYLLIITTGNIPGARADIGQVAPGPVLHSIAYAVLAALWFVGSDGSPAARAARAVLAVAAMGALDEIIQSFFPWRGASAADWLVDCTAAIVASALLYALLRTAVLAKR